MPKAPADRTVTPAEVRAWFGKSARWQLGAAQYRDFAAYITRLRWPSDPPIADRRDTETKGAEYWDFRAAKAAAKLLLASTPAMRRHWRGLRSAPKPNNGYSAVDALAEALANAMPYLESPFGGAKCGSRHRPLKSWHMLAPMIAGAVLSAALEAGRGEPGLTRNSVVMRVVREALIRMGDPTIEMATTSAIAAHLIRWRKKYGLVPRPLRP